jgi:hypothetical protein
VDAGWQPEFYVTPDSICIWFPNDWPDTTVWSWNQSPAGRWEYVMEAAVDVPIGGGPRAYFSVHAAFVRESDGSGIQYGSFQELAAGGLGYFWTENKDTGDYGIRPIAANTVRVFPDGIEIRVWNNVAWIIYGNAPAYEVFWPVTFERRGRFDRKIVRRPAHYAYDVAQDRAREVDGPLTPDDYAIMDLVAREYARSLWFEPLVIVKQTATYVGINESNNIQVLRAQDETLAAYSLERTSALTLDALSQLGYIVADINELPSGNHASFSAIGYNRARNEAMIYGSYYCGSLCAKGEVLLLQKVGGYWRISNRVGLWVS